LEEVRIAEHRACGRKSSSGVTVNAGAIYVDPRKPRGELFHSAHLIGQRVVAHIAVVRVMEFLGARGVSHTIDLDHDKTQLRKRLRIAASSRKRSTAHASPLGARIDVIY